MTKNKTSKKNQAPKIADTAVSASRDSSGVSTSRYNNVLTVDLNEIVATVNINGKSAALNRIEFSDYISKNYKGIFFPWQESFNAYHNAHVMDDVLTKLKSGMDEVSCLNIDHHEKLIRANTAQDKALYHVDLLFNQIDKKLMARYEEIKASKKYPLLDSVNLEWGSCFTNCYGLYDAQVEVLNRLNGKDIIDVGAFVGDSASLFVTLFNKSKIYAFEPSKHNLENMHQYLGDVINEGRIIPVAKGLAANPGTLKLSKVQGNVDSMASLQYDYKGPLYEEVEVITLDSYVKEHKLYVGLIKIDVEGYEPEVLKGALNTIKEQKPMLVIAFYHTPDEFYELKSYIENLNLGYTFSVRRSCFGSPLMEYVLICTPNAS